MQNLQKKTDVPDWQEKMPADEVQLLINMIDNSSKPMNKASGTFVDSMRQRANDYDPVIISQAQYSWLIKLID